MNDAEIVRRVLAGDVNAYALLVDGHGARLLGVISRHVPPDRAAYLYRVFRSYDLHDSSRFILPGVPFYEDKQAYWKVDSVKTKELFESRK